VVSPVFVSKTTEVLSAGEEAFMSLIQNSMVIWDYEERIFAVRAVWFAVITVCIELKRGKSLPSTHVLFEDAI